MRRVALALASLAVAAVCVAHAPPAPAGASTGYNGAAAAAYADKYWSSYNSAYPSFATSGGDCANFVSQALSAGGIAMRQSSAYSGDAAWYMNQTRPSKWSYSTTWINAQHQNNFVLGSLGATRTATFTPTSAIAPGTVVTSTLAAGDIVYYDWTSDGTIDHEAIVATADGQYVDAHTNNRYHAYWTLAQYNTQWQTTALYATHIPATAQ